MLRHKKSNKDLKKLHFILLEVGLVLSLIIFIVAFSYNMGKENNKGDSDKTKSVTDKQEVIKSKDVVRTRQGNQQPRPPSPQPPVEVPNNEVIEGNVQEQLDQIDQQVSSGEKISLPPPPEQGETDTEEKIFRIVEKEPQIVGGLDSLQSLIEYPELARKTGIEGRVYLEFIVTKEGKVKNPKVIRGPGAGLNKQLNREVSTFLRYMLQAASIKGAEYESVRQMYLEEVMDEVEHAQYLANQIEMLGGKPNLDPDLTPPPEEVMEMLKNDSEEEKEDVKNYQQLADMAEEEGLFSLKMHMEDQGAEEDEHGQEMRRLMGK